MWIAIDFLQQPVSYFPPSWLIQQQSQYIRQLEKQLAVYEEKDKAQELLIEKLNLALNVFAQELSKAKAETKENSTGEE